VRAANLALKFLLELAAIAALAYWGATAADGVPAVALAVGAPALFIVLWGRFAAPRAAHRLPARSRIPFELGLFALAALAWCSPAARSSRRCSPCWLSSTPRS
jgi:hypothetical protein